jgi:hypothetical protein
LSGPKLLIRKDSEYNKLALDFRGMIQSTRVLGYNYPDHEQWRRWGINPRRENADYNLGLVIIKILKLADKPLGG